MIKNFSHVKKVSFLSLNRGNVNKTNGYTCDTFMTNIYKLVTKMTKI